MEEPNEFLEGIGKIITFNKTIEEFNRKLVDMNIKIITPQQEFELRIKIIMTKNKVLELILLQEFFI